MIVTLDGNDAQKILDDVNDAQALATDVTNVNGISLEDAYYLGERLKRSGRLLAGAITAEAGREGGE